MRREERVTVQGPVKKQQPDGMAHGGGGGWPGTQTRPPPPLPLGSLRNGLAAPPVAPSQEISANIAEGVNFYARMSEVMDQYKSKVEDFVYARNVQKEDLLGAIQREAAHIETGQELEATLKELELEEKKQQEALQV